MSSPPPVAQRVLFGGLAPLGRLLGRQPVYPKYLFSREIVEPDPAALALLDAQGRLQIENPPCEPRDYEGERATRRGTPRARGRPLSMAQPGGGAEQLAFSGGSAVMKMARAACPPIILPTIPSECDHKEDRQDKVVHHGP